ARPGAFVFRADSGRRRRGHRLQRPECRPHHQIRRGWDGGDRRRLEVAPRPHGCKRPETDRAGDHRYVPVVGGTISTGGFGVTTYNLGLQVDHVQELEVVTGDGQIVTCSDERNSDLFNAMLGGLGQCGIITKVVMRLIEAPTNVLFIKMDYDDFQSASADLALLAKDGRFHHLDGRGAGRPTGGVGYYVEG